jgi:photosystem II stability/assembly factor-like uncharacterized protein
MPPAPPSLTLLRAVPILLPATNFSPWGTVMFKYFLAILLIAVSATFASAQEDGKIHQPKLTPQSSGTTQLLIAVSPVDSRVVWAAGTGGTYVVTTDGGNTWKAGVVPGTTDDPNDELQFRDVQGVSDKVAYLMSIGNNASDFKIYKTTDGGATWNIQFTNELANAFYDCFSFWTPIRGITHSDSVNGVFPDIRTTDGKTWHSISANMPQHLERLRYAARQLVQRRRRLGRIPRFRARHSRRGRFEFQHFRRRSHFR